ncbi:MAG: flagellar motor switch protein FliN [Spartobacteria bacterium]|nr:flagellar motor switch protein FliN [Spartobacteria bacterium]
MAENDETLGNDPMQDDAAKSPENEGGASEEPILADVDGGEETPSPEEQAMLDSLDADESVDGASDDEQAMLDSLDADESGRGASDDEQAMIDSLMNSGKNLAEDAVSDEEKAMLSQLGLDEDFDDSVEVSPVELPTVESSPERRSARDTEDENLKMILDIPVDVHVEIGTTRAAIRDILKMGTGSVVELDRMAGQPADIIANGKLIAWGDVVIVNENFGVRITKILKPEERVEAL